jgi:transcriptional regulator with XRE-family HTH domain
VQGIITHFKPIVQFFTFYFKSYQKSSLLKGNFGKDFVNSQTQRIKTTIMEEDIKQIGERLKGLREVLNIPAQEVADLCGITLEHYKKIEAGEADPSVYRLSKISKRYGIDLEVLLFGEEPHMSSYYITRKGEGPEIDRGDDYKYQSIASGFRGRKVDPFIAQVDPLPGDKNHSKNTTNGQEFVMVFIGTLELTIDDKVLVLNEGDSIYYDGRVPHCMRALNGHSAIFLDIVID